MSKLLYRWFCKQNLQVLDDMFRIEYTSIIDPAFHIGGILGDTFEGTFIRRYYVGNKNVG
jgi:hypothetical protein